MENRRTPTCRGTPKKYHTCPPAVPSEEPSAPPYCGGWVVPGAYPPPEWGVLFGFCRDYLGVGCFEIFVDYGGVVSGFGGDYGDCFCRLFLEILCFLYIEHNILKIGFTILKISNKIWKLKSTGKYKNTKYRLVVASILIFGVSVFSAKSCGVLCNIRFRMIWHVKMINYNN